MTKTLFFILFVFLTLVRGNDRDSTLNRWNPSLTASINLSQIAFDNWSKGGKNAYSYELGIDWKAEYKTSGWKFKNRFKGAIGHSKLGEDKINITSNTISNETVFFGPGFLLKPYISNLIRTPITNGFNYKKNPPEHIVSFFDPGYITQSIGIAFEKEKVFKTRLGLAFEESFSSKFAPKYTDDLTTVSKVEKFKLETGIESITDLNYEVADNVQYKGIIRFFSAFERIEIWDVTFDNKFIAKVNNWLNVNLTYVVVYKKSESLKAQQREGVQIGIVYNLF